ncbi:MAG TPA: DUF4159 domain-containing protein [Longimicrobiales bacterium]|nr:DUF4159 domain-containing protein [Longimicrobiales bacterium]
MNRSLVSVVLALLVLGFRPIGTGAPPALTIAQLQYDGGGDWYANPSGLPNLLRAIRERTGLPVSDDAGRVRLTDPSLWSYPFLYMTGHGNVRFSDEEVRTLRRYLLEGGFLHVDDNYGLDESFRREIRRVFPDRELQELPATHPVFRVFYQFPAGLPKVHRHDDKAPQAFGIFDRGRLVLFYSYESDLGNGWEDADKYDDTPEAREAALRMGINLFMYALAQVVP